MTMTRQLVKSGTGAAANYRSSRVASLLDEADQIVRILVASIKTTRRNGV
jgi:hypothetical protein